MTRPASTSLVTVALPVRNGASTLPGVVESVLAQDHEHLELLICDNASTDATAEVCRQAAAGDRRVVVHRHETNIGLLNNFRSAAELASGDYLRWIGDSDRIEPDYLSRTLAAFDEDDRRVLVTTQVAYVDEDGAVSLDRTYDPGLLAADEAGTRFAELLRLLTSGFELLDPLYGLMRRDVTVLPRRNMLREDEVYAARLALAGPWGHVPAPLAVRGRSEVSTRDLASMLDVPRWQRPVRDLLQCRELLVHVERAPLSPTDLRRARAAVVRLYLRRKGGAVQRGAGALPRRVRRLSGSRSVSAGAASAG